MKTATPVMLAFLLLLVTFGLSISDNDLLSTPGDAPALFSKFDIGSFYNSNNVNDVSWEYIVSGLAKEDVPVEETKNYYVRSKRNSPSDLENEQRRIYRGKYTYTNIDTDTDDESLKSTLKRTKILPMP